MSEEKKMPEIEINGEVNRELIKSYVVRLAQELKSWADEKKEEGLPEGVFSPSRHSYGFQALEDGTMDRSDVYLIMEGTRQLLWTDGIFTLGYWTDETGNTVPIQRTDDETTNAYIDALVSQQTDSSLFFYYQLPALSPRQEDQLDDHLIQLMSHAVFQARREGHGIFCLTDRDYEIKDFDKQFGHFPFEQTEEIKMIPSWTYRLYVEEEAWHYVIHYKGEYDLVHSEGEECFEPSDDMMEGLEALVEALMESHIPSTIYYADRNRLIRALIGEADDNDCQEIQKMHNPDQCHVYVKY